MRINLAVTRFEEEPQSDPRLMSPNQIRSYADQGGFPHITDVARKALGQLGGRKILDWPEPLRQRGVSCQTVAVINGVRCYQAANQGHVWTPDFGEVEVIRHAAGQLQGYSEQAAGSVARLFVAEDILKSAERIQQPIKAMEAMASGGFAVVTSGEAWHATTVIPNLGCLAMEAEGVPQLITIDSVAGTQTGTTVEQFCATMLAQDWERHDETLVCTVV